MAKAWGPKVNDRLGTLAASDSRAVRRPTPVCSRRRTRVRSTDAAETWYVVLATKMRNRRTGWRRSFGLGAAERRFAGHRSFGRGERGTSQPLRSELRDPCYFDRAFRSSGDGCDGLDGSERTRFRAFRHSVSRIADVQSTRYSRPRSRSAGAWAAPRGLGAVVDVHPPDGLEVEFILVSGKTQALVTVRQGDVRAVGDGDLITVRDLKRTA
jgi:hypothetical protein